MDNSSKISLVIVSPCFNEEELISTSSSKLNNKLEALVAKEII